jgi:hypothetical protein
MNWRLQIPMRSSNKVVNAPSTSKTCRWAENWSKWFPFARTPQNTHTRVFEYAICINMQTAESDTINSSVLLVWNGRMQRLIRYICGQIYVSAHIETRTVANKYTWICIWKLITRGRWQLSRPASVACWPLVFLMRMRFLTPSAPQLWVAQFAIVATLLIKSYISLIFSALICGVLLVSFLGIAIFGEGEYRGNLRSEIKQNIKYVFDNVDTINCQCQVFDSWIVFFYKVVCKYQNFTREYYFQMDVNYKSY